MKIRDQQNWRTVEKPLSIRKAVKARLDSDRTVRLMGALIQKLHEKGCLSNADVLDLLGGRFEDIEDNDRDH
jgi:hypothetical protein